MRIRIHTAKGLRRRFRAESIRDPEHRFLRIQVGTFGIWLHY